MIKPVRSLLWTLLVFLPACAAPADTIVGNVVDETGAPLAGAVVRVRTTKIETTADLEGQFVLAGLAPEEPVFVTAWIEGYYINGAADILPGEDVEIVLQPLHTSDDPTYTWLPSRYHPGAGENQGCAECHSSGEADNALPVDQWLLDAHANTASNPRFLTMYLGTDIFGNQSPQTRYATARDYGSFPLPPDLEQSYFGPGYKLDFPNIAGNCAACHTPAASVNNPYGVDPTMVSGVAAEGIPCDFCHKIWDVQLNPKKGLPYANMPGVLSYQFLRPPEGHQFFAGPYDDVAPGEDTYSPLQQQSQFCAPCHYGVFWDTLIYNSFGEWLESPYSDPETGQTCQDCHMPTGVEDHFALTGVGGQIRNPETIFSHQMPGASELELLQNAVSLSMQARRENNEIVLSVDIFNDNTGHHIPTDSPLRHLILIVQAADASGNALSLISGPIIPAWGGVGEPDEGYYAGLPGTIYAKVLEELWTEVSPSGAYWNPTRIVSDNRIAAQETASSSYRFIAPEEGPTMIEVHLVYRRAFIELMEQKGWNVPDIVIALDRLTLD